VGDEVNMVTKELQILLDKVDIQWRQKAKLDWLRGGGRNKKFYHACANVQRKLNQNVRIIDEEGMSCKLMEVVQTAFISYFS
jgi:hypothetical protein